MYTFVSMISEIIYTVNLDSGFGNQLFKLASIYGLSRKHNTKFVIYSFLIDKSPHSSQGYQHFYSQWLALSTPVNTNFIQINENGKDCLTYIEYQPQSTNTFFKGYYQTSKYFQHIKDEICDMWKAPEDIKNKLQAKYDLENAAFIHVRLNDYLLHYPASYFENLHAYYKKALEKFKNNENANIKFYLCTDDPQKCREMFPEFNKLQAVAEDEINTLWFMSLCKYGGICANSTFSWWGSYLNTSPVKIVCMPQKWLNNSDQAGDIHYEGVYVI